MPLLLLQREEKAGVQEWCAIMNQNFFDIIFHSLHVALLCYNIAWDDGMRDIHTFDVKFEVLVFFGPGH